MRLLTESVPWPRDPGHIRRAGISAFGVGGTNAHVIIEEAPFEDEQRTGATADSAGANSDSARGPGVQVSPGGQVGSGAPEGTGGPVAWVLSGRTPAALRDQARRLHERFAGAAAEVGAGSMQVDAVGVGAGLALTRSHFEHRAALVAEDPADLLDGVAALARGGSHDTVRRGRSRGGKVAFLFPGQGSQWLGMGRELAGAHPVFADALERCADALAPWTDWSPHAVLAGRPGAAPLDRVDVVQPALFAVMTSLAALWRHHGVRPDAVVGHSQGEIAAACVAGGLDLADAARVVALRSRAIAGLLGTGGGMVSVTAEPALVVGLVERWQGRIEVAAVNGPSSLTLSGEATALTELLDVCAAEGVWARRIPVDYASHSPQVDRIEGELARELGPITPHPGSVRFHSTVTGGELDTTALDAGYWFRNLRQRVRFEEVVRGLLDQGFTTFVEVSPHPVLTVPVEQTIEAVDARAAVFGTLQRDTGAGRFTAALAEAHAHGAPVAWNTVFDPADSRRISLPTYAFQTERFWATPRPTTGDTAGAGLENTAHPLLTASTQLADGGGRLFTARISRDTQPWLTDHAVHDTVLVPGTAFVELVARAGEAEGCPLVEELTLEEPLAVPAEGELRLQTIVGAPDERLRRTVTVYSKDVAAPTQNPWTRHASGVLAPQESAPDGTAAHVTSATWPPPGAEPLAVTGLYDRLAERGFGYGPAFRELRAAWRDGDTVYAEVGTDGAEVTDDDGGGEPATDRGYGLHPALWDAAFHIQLTALAPNATGDDGAGAWLPFTWSGVRVHRNGARALRVTLTPVPATAPTGVGRADSTASTVRMTATDGAGRPVVTVDSVTARPVAPERIAALRDAGDSLFRLDWTPVALADATAPLGSVALLGEAARSWAWGWADERYADLDALLASLDGGRPAPTTVVVPFVPVAAADAAPAAPDVHGHARRALDLLRRWTADERLAGTALVVVTRRAVNAGTGTPVEPETAAVWGLLRGAEAEHPGRFLLVDLDEEEAAALIPVAVAQGEPQLAVRAGALVAPRVVRAATGGTAGPFPFVPEGTVLVTGGTSGIGASVARHLAARGAGRLLLVSRRGAAAPGAAALARDLRALGAEVTLAACDLADRTAVRDLLSAVPVAHPLTAVVHSAGVLDDGLVADLTADRLERVLRPKVDAALHLHELTAGLDLSSFVLFSSVAGTVGSPGQANYAAGNAFLDALAHWRMARGLPALSLAWGLWEESSDMTQHLDGVDVARLHRSGVAPMPTEEALRLFDAVHGTAHAHLLPVRLDPAALRARARAQDLPPVLKALVPADEARSHHTGSLRAVLAGTSVERREAVTRRLVAEHVAAALGHEHGETVDQDRSFKDLGLDSLGAVRVRNLLRGATGITLPVTVVFSHPSVAALAAHLLTLVEQEAPQGGAAEPGDRTGAVAHRELERLAAALTALDATEADAVGTRLRVLLADLERRAGTGASDVGADLESASADEVFDLIDNGLEVR
ncbi:SDR family NAD(P)-dependent oxidoreductase [Streptomyces sp. NPDC059578]|uniref:SDR family NAD(P)-dependent oxidoreductase n=1 Tax=Streptomyces sp. NPDC059578 TaxID=3346874 RepID=UPI0036C2732B